ncbi:MAG: aldolase/citrate lyase family protein [Thermoanaerobaculia bacterium]|nr:aldolase/citrate lyase family protein [Thermoanaerobaculia bacterium]
MTGVHKVLKDRLRAGEVVHGLLSPNVEPDLVETLGLLGFDFYILDAEHGRAGPPEAAAVVRASEGAGLAPLVRPRSLDAKLILQFLDAGMTGIMLPGVRNADDVKRLVEAVKYPPAGLRGLAAMRANGFLLGAEKQEDWVLRSNRETVVLPQIETVEALERVEELAAVPGIDGFIVGPRDLALALGFPDGPGHPEIESAIDLVVAVAKRRGLVVGTVAPTDARAKDLAARGLTIMLHSVTGLLKTGAEAYFKAAKG